MKFCLITGASGGIGRALVNSFSAAGYHVIATDIGKQPEGMLCTHYIQADLVRIVNDEAYADELFDRIRQYLKGSGLNVLINNAAIQILGGTESLTRQDWRQSLDVNLIAPFLFTQSLLSELESVKGCVLNISSIHARLTKRNFVAYATTKAALSGITRALAVDLGARVRVNAIEPAAIETDMLKAGFEGDPARYQQLKSLHPSNSIGLPEEVANLAFAITCGGMNFLHGSCVGLDGGIGARLFDPD